MKSRRAIAWAVVIVVLCGVPLLAAMVKPRDSKEPMSTAPTRLMPRSSPVGAGDEPLLMAGLPGNMAIVCVGPPLSASVPRPAAAAERLSALFDELAVNAAPHTLG